MTNIKFIEKACSELDLEFAIFRDNALNEVLVIEKSKIIFFNSDLPINSHSVVQLFRYKNLFYRYFETVTKQPKTFELVKNANKEIVIKNAMQILENNYLSYPLVVKMNTGYESINVFIVQDTNELYDCILKIFYHGKKFSDNICLIQEYINVKKEYRAIFLYGELQFAYEKRGHTINYQNELSNIEWHEADIQIVISKQTISKILKVSMPIFDKLKIPFCVIDVVENDSGDTYIIEGNTSPEFHRFFNSKLDRQIIELYKNMIRTIYRNNYE